MTKQTAAGDEDKATMDKICSKCFQTIGRGLRHPCTKEDQVSNLEIILKSQG